jgi:hypothetical protein
LHTLGVQNRRRINTAAKTKSLHSKHATTCDHTEQQLKAALHVLGRRSHPTAPDCAPSSTLSTTSNGALNCLQKTQGGCAAATDSSISNAVHRALQQSLQSSSSSKTAPTGNSCATFQ